MLARDDIHFERREFRESSQSRDTVLRAVQMFLTDARSRDLTEDTLDYYTRKLRPFTNSLAVQGVKRIQDVETEHVQQYIIGLRDGGMSPANLNSHGRALKAFLRWAADNELIDVMVARRFRLPKGNPTIVREVFSPDELTALLEAAGRTPTPERDTALLLLMIDTGIRAGEVGRIRDSDVEFDRVLIHGKGRRQRAVPISNTTRKAIAKYQRKRGQSEYLFMTRLEDPFTRQTVFKLFKRLGDAANVHPSHPHMVRRSVATQWIKAGGDGFTLMSLLGHSSSEMTRVYVQMADESMLERHRSLSLVDRLKKEGRHGHD